MSQISYVKYLDVLEARRFDAEYFKPEYLRVQEKLRKVNSIKFRKILSKITGGATPLGAEYSESGIPFLRVQNIMPNYFNDSLVYISKQQDEMLRRSKLKEGDVLLTITGVSYGKSAVVEKRYDEANINQHSVLMRFKERGINPFYVSTFLNCYYGKKQSDKNIVGLSRPALDYNRIKDYFLIPIFPKFFQLEIERIVKYAHKKQTRFKELYREAEELLLEELGLSDCKIKKALWFTTTKKEVNDACRFDAEYFHPKYKEIIEKIEQYRGGYVRLEDKNFAKLNRGSLIPDKYYTQEKGFGYIRGADFSSSNLSKEKLVFISKNFSFENKTQVFENDIVFSLIGSVGASAYVSSDFDGYFISNNTGKIALKTNYNSIVLQVFLQSIVGQMQFEKEKMQTAQPKISLKEIEKFKIPLIRPSIQQKIVEKIQASHQLRKESKELLEEAKRKVEEEIEKG